MPLRRFGEPGEVAERIALLVSDRAAFITGETIQISGGWTLRPGEPRRRGLPRRVGMS